MNTKKILAIALALMLALSLVACGGRKSATLDPAPEVTATGEPIADDDMPGDVPEEPAEQETTDDPAIMEEPSDELVVGVVTDNQYTNKALGIAFTLPEGWSFATDEEIALYMQLSADMITDAPEALKEALQAQPNFFDVIASDSSLLNNFNISYTDLAQTGLGALISEDAYATLVQYQYAEMEMFDGAEYTKGSHQLGGETFVTLSIDTTAAALGQYQRQYLKKLGTDYLVAITISGISMEAVDKVASMFMAVQ